MTLKLKRTPGLYLLGFMGSGKSTVGRALADRLGWEFSDIDLEIEQREGHSIADIFAERGEETFRLIESEAVRRRATSIEAGNPCVVALGGGACVQPGNWEAIANSGVTIWLQCSFGRIRNRVLQDATRPLANDAEGLERLFQVRLPHYQKSDYAIDADCDDPASVVGRILTLPIF
jgi:shikimate kinase